MSVGKQERASVVFGAILDTESLKKQTKQAQEALGKINGKPLEFKFSTAQATRNLNVLRKELKETSSVTGKLMNTTTTVDSNGWKLVAEQIELANGSMATLNTKYDAAGKLQWQNVKYADNLAKKEAERVKAITSAHAKYSPEQELAVKQELVKLAEKEGRTLSSYTITSSKLNKDKQQVLTIQREETKKVKDELGEYEKTYKVIQDIVVAKTRAGNIKTTAGTVSNVTTSEDDSSRIAKNQKAIEDEAKAVQILTDKIIKLQTNVEIFQKRANSTGETLNSKFVKSSHHGQVDKLTESINTASKEILEFKIDANMTSEELEKFYKQASIGTLNIRKLKTDLDETGKQIRSTGKYALNLGEMMKNAFKGFSVWMGVTTVFYQAFAALKSGIDSVTALDTSLVNFNKVADVTASQLESITKRAFEMGEGLAQTGTAVLDATTDFVQAGYNIEDSLAMAQNAMILMNVGEVELADATDVLISATENYNISALDSIEVANKLNEVSNTTSAEVGNLADGLQRTAGILGQTGTTLDENLGLLAAGFTTLRNMEKVSSGLITIASRLNRVDSETGELNEEFPKLEKMFNQVGMTLMDSNGELKSTYDILQELSKIYPTLNSLQRENLNFQIAGSRQGNVLTAILNEFNIAEQAVTDSLNSQNSAANENAKRIDSIEGKIRTLQSAWQKMWSDFISSDIVKFIIEVATSFIKLMDYIGLAGFALAAFFTAMQAIKGFNMIQTIQAIGTGFTMLATQIKAGTFSLNLFTAAEGTATVAATALMAALTFGLSVAITALVVAITKAVTKSSELKKSIENVTNSMKDFYELKDTAVEALEDFNGTLDKDKLDTFASSVKALREEFELLKTGTDFEKKKSEIEELQKYIDTLNLDPVRNAAEIEIEEENLSRLMEKYGSLVDMEKTVEDQEKKLKSATYIYNRELKKVVPVQEEAKYTAEELAGAYDLFTDNVSTLASTYKTLNNEEVVGFEILKQLIDTYPQFSDRILAINDSKEEGINLTKELFELEKQVAIDKQKMAIEEARANYDVALSVYQQTKAKNELIKSNEDLSKWKLNVQTGQMEYTEWSAKQQFDFNAGADATVQASINELKKQKALLTLYETSTFETFNKDTSGTGSDKEEEIKELEAYFYILQEISRKQAQIEREKSVDALDEISHTDIIITQLTEEQNLLKKLNIARRADVDLLKAKLALEPGNVELIQQIADLESDIRDTSQDWWNIEQEKKDLLQEQTDLLQEQKELEMQALADASSKYADYLQGQLDAVNALIDATEELIKQEKESQKEYIQGLKEELSYLQEKEDYNDSLAEQSKTLADIENEIALASRDTSQAGIAKVAQLNEDKTKAEKELSETQSDWQVKNQEKMYDDEIELIDDYLSKSGELTADAIDRINADVKSGANTLMTELVNWNEVYGTSIESDITSMWAAATEALKNYQSVSEAQSSLQSSIKLASSDSEIKTLAEYKSDMQQNSNAWKATSDSDMQKWLADENQRIADKITKYYGISLKRTNGTWYDTSTGKQFYDQGGEANGIGYLAKNTLKPERMLSPEQTIAFNKLVDYLPSMMGLSNGLPKVSSANNSANVTIAMPINIEGNADESTVSSLQAVTKTITSNVMTAINNSFGLNGQYKLKTT